MRVGVLSDTHGLLRTRGSTGLPLRVRLHRSRWGHRLAVPSSTRSRPGTAPSRCEVTMTLTAWGRAFAGDRADFGLAASSFMPFTTDGLQRDIWQAACGSSSAAFAQAPAGRAERRVVLQPRQLWATPLPVAGIHRRVADPGRYVAARLVELVSAGDLDGTEAPAAPLLRVLRHALPPDSRAARSLMRMHVLRPLCGCGAAGSVHELRGRAGAASAPPTSRCPPRLHRAGVKPGACIRN